MSSIIVTITDEKKSFYYDLDVPSDLVAEKLVQDIVETLNGLNPILMLSHFGTSLVCSRTQKRVHPNETLSDAHIRNGDYIILSGGGY